MRLQFNLKKVKLSPICHIQINRHAEQLRNRYAVGQLYGALYDDEAHITNIMPYPDADNMQTREELEAMDQRHLDMLNKYNLDNSHIGWYMVSYKQNLWEQLELVQYNQKYINTFFFLVYDYEARLVGKNPYKAYRLTDQFCLNNNYSLSKINPNQISNPFVQIPVQTQKNQIFETLMLFNKPKIMRQFMKHNNNKQKKDSLKHKVEAYIESLEQQAENNRVLSERSSKEQKTLNFSQYCQNLGILLKAENQEKVLRNYEENIILTKKILEN